MTIFCSSCASSNDDDSKFCQKCGAQLMRTGAVSQANPNLTSVNQGGVVVPPGKSPIVSAVLSGVVVGVGQFYNGDWKKGVAMLGLGVAGWLFTGGILWLATAIWSVIDAYQVASGKMKRW